MTLSPLIVEERRRELLAARPLHRPRRRPFPSGILRGARWLRRAPRRAAAA